MTSHRQKKTLRLNARVDAKIAKKIQVLAKRQKKTVSEIICESIEQMFDRECDANAFDLLTRAGFVASFEGSDDLSADYKRKLGQSLASKHGIE